VRDTLLGEERLRSRQRLHSRLPSRCRCRKHGSPGNFCAGRARRGPARPSGLSDPAGALDQVRDAVPLLSTAGSAIRVTGVGEPPLRISCSDARRTPMPRSSDHHSQLGPNSFPRRGSAKSSPLSRAEPARAWGLGHRVSTSTAPPGAVRLRSIGSPQRPPWCCTTYYLHSCQEPDLVTHA
jgi:hypothetical protein